MKGPVALLSMTLMDPRLVEKDFTLVKKPPLIMRQSFLQH